MRSLIFGTSDDVEDLILELFKQKLDIDFEHDYYLNIPPPPKEDTTIDYGDSVVSGVICGFNSGTNRCHSSMS